jgi:hypothetical protein
MNTDQLFDWCETTTGIPLPDSYNRDDTYVWFDEIYDRLTGTYGPEVGVDDLILRFALLLYVAMYLEDSGLANLRAVTAATAWARAVAGKPFDTHNDRLSELIDPTVTSETLHDLGAYIHLHCDKRRPPSAKIALAAPGVEPIVLGDASNVATQEDLLFMLDQHFLPHPNHCHIERWDGYEITAEW